MRPAITWFVDNPVAANLLMWILVLGGLLTAPSIRMEEFPTIDANTVQISVPYPGAAPEEVEQGVCIRIEEAIDSVEGIQRISTSAYEALCVVSAELIRGSKRSKVVSDIQSKVDSIVSFPKETEKPVVAETTILANVLQIAITGEINQRALKEIGERVRDDIAELPGVSQVALLFTKPYEISIEVSEFTLRRYGLKLDSVAEAIRAASVDIPGGSIKTVEGEILLRTKGQAYIGEDFEDIVVLTRTDGTILTVGDIATIRDGFEEVDLEAEFDDKPAVMIKVYRVGEEDVLAIARRVKQFLAHHQSTLPAGVEFVVWKDESQDLRDRMAVLGRNAGGGLILVLLILALFLKLRLAFWVALGLPIALLGTLTLFPLFNLSISTMSVMAFILVLGILVDDAIVVGERVHAYEMLGYSRRDAAVFGTHEVAVPVIFGVLTTMTAFLPLLMMISDLSSFFKVVGGTAMLALVFSIAESQCILPAHLAHRGSSTGAAKSGKPQRWQLLQQRTSDWLRHFAGQRYQPLLRRALHWRYLTLAIGTAAIMLTAALIVSGRITFQYFPAFSGERVYATVTMAEGTPYAEVAQAAAKIKHAARQLRAELDEAGVPTGHESNVKHIIKTIGSVVSRGSIDSSAANTPTRAEVVMELLPDNERDTISSSAVANRWRELTGPVSDAVALQFSADFFSAGEAINIRLRGPDTEELKAAADELSAALERFDGVYDISDSFRAGKQEVQLALRPEAKPLGISLLELGSQVRQAFYGEEVQRVQRGKEDVRVMVRYPEQERRSLTDLENMRIRTSEKIEVPFGNVAEASLGYGFATIKRENGERIISVIADVNRGVVEPERVLAALEAQFKPVLNRKYPNVEYSLGGEAEDSLIAMEGLGRWTLLALLMIYALLAIPLRSYSQPLVIMSVIPFGAIGAVLGHYLLGVDLVFFSVLGIVALSGVVVNASLVLVDYINKRRSAGEDVVSAVATAGAVRFRPIVLTSLTTFVGLIPIMADQNPSTIIFVPMAISLAFGVLFATAVTLFLVPCLYLILDDAINSLRGEPLAGELV